MGFATNTSGSPTNIGSQKDLEVQLAPGTDIESSIRGATLVLPAGGRDQSIYTSRPSNWAPRAAFAFDITGTGNTLLRGSYGIFYDRPFDNLWENVIQNRYSTAVWKFSGSVPLNVSLAQLEAAGQLQTSSNLIPFLAFQPSLRAPRTQSAFLGIQQKVTKGVDLEVDGLASRSTQLITTDQVNRDGTLNPSLAGYINYRANQGSAHYAGLSTVIRFRKTRVHGQLAYTWSHSLDNQSDPLAGTFFDFNTFSAARAAPSPYISSFTRQFASGLDWGNSDFDQRQNLVFFLTYEPPSIFSKQKVGAFFRNWIVLPGLGAVRSGLPFTVYAISNYSAAIPEIFVNQRANLNDPGLVYSSQPASGGRVLLNPAAFSNPGPNVIGSSGRNEFFGPGFYNIDLSVSRTFSIFERLRLRARADFYNALNHSNLNNPASFLGSSDFGLALYGRSEVNNGFPLSSPANETARQIQILLRLEF